MSKRQNRNRGERGRRDRLSPELHQEPSVIKKRANREPIKPRTENQSAYLNSINVNTLTFGLGPAGTGKTYVAAATAADMLRDGEIDRVIITRPAVEAGESLGFLPGELEEKFDPYFAPVREIFEERLGTGHLEAYLSNGRIQVKPLAYMRGTTFKNAFVILDEAQNSTPKQMEMFLTRIGENTRVIVNGDLKQTDIKGKNGLSDAVSRVAHLKSVGVIKFDRSDIVRSGLVQEIVEAYEYNGDDAFTPEKTPEFLR